MSHDKVRALNELKFHQAKVYCSSCPVLSQCEEDAQATRATPWGVRGGLSPYDRPDVEPGRILGDLDAAQIESAEANLRAWEGFLKGIPLNEMPKGAKDRLKGLKHRFVEGREPDAEWRTYKFCGRTHVGGQGWAVSQDRTRSVVRVMYLSFDGKLLSKFVNRRDAVYDDVITPKVLMYWPEGIDLPITV